MDAKRYDAVIFDLLTVLIDSWTLWNAVAGSDDAGLRWRCRYLELTYRAPLDAMKAAPSRTLFVAGSAADVSGARAAGMNVYRHNRIGLKPIDAALPDFTEGSLHLLRELA